MQAVVIALGCLPEMKASFLCVKIPWASDRGPRGTKLILTWKPSHLSMSPHGTIKHPKSFQMMKATNNMTLLW